MRPVIVSLLAGGIAGALAGGAVVKLSPPPAPRTFKINSAAPSQTTLMRIAADQWAEIGQSEVDALTAVLKNVPAEARKTVTIFCQSDTRCGDLALNLENAFESARWTVERKPIVLPDGMVGVLVNDERIRTVMDQSTSLKPKLLDEPTAGGGIGIIVGTKPKG